MSRMTMDELLRREQQRTVAQVAASEATTRRNEAVRALVAQGTRQADIARALGVTRGRVSQIIDATPAG